MADQKITDLTAGSALADSDLIEVSQDISTTPTSKKFTWTLVKSFLKTYFDTLYSIEKLYEVDIVVSAAEQNVTIVPADAASWLIVTEIYSVIKSITGTTSATSNTTPYYNGSSKAAYFQGAVNNLVGWIYEKKSYGALYFINEGDHALIIKQDSLPAGVTACTIKVIVKGFKIAK